MLTKILSVRRKIERDFPDQFIELQLSCYKNHDE